MFPLRFLNCLADGQPLYAGDFSLITTSSCNDIL